jgi:preprotein translocase subunit SecG
MQTVLIVVHLLIVIALIATVLLQRSEGGALGMGGGGSGGGNFFSGRGQANALTRATAILATLFFMTSLGLTVLATYTRSQKSIFETPTATAPASAAPAAVQSGPGFFDRVRQSAHDGLKQMEQGLESPAGADASKASFPDRVKQIVRDGLKSMEQALESPAASNAVAPDAASPATAAPDAKGTVLDRLKQMQKNAPPAAPDTEQAPPRSR